MSCTTACRLRCATALFVFILAKLDVSVFLLLLIQQLIDGAFRGHLKVHLIAVLVPQHALLGIEVQRRLARLRLVFLYIVGHA